MLKKIMIDKTGALSHADDFIAFCDRAAAVVKQIGIEELSGGWQQHAEHFIDVRDLEELQQQGYIPGACHLSKGWLEANIHHLTTDKSAVLILYCGSGKRSLLAAQSLQQMGYLKVCSLQGGFKAWKAAGQAIEHMDLAK